MPLATFLCGPKIPPMDLLDSDYKSKLNDHKSERAKASEIENAIKNHIKVNIEEDPEYYKSLSERLEKIIQDNKEKWESLVQLLLEFRDNINELLLTCLSIIIAAVPVALPLVLQVTMALGAGKMAREFDSGWFISTKKYQSIKIPF